MFCGNCGTKQGGLPSTTQLVQYEQTQYEPPPPPSPVYNQTIINVPSPAQNVSIPPSTGAERKLRHGFTSFWLWVNFIGSIFGLLSVLILRLSYDEDGWIEEIIQYIYSISVQNKSPIYHANSK